MMNSLGCHCFISLAICCQSGLPFLQTMVSKGVAVAVMDWPTATPIRLRPWSKQRNTLLLTRGRYRKTVYPDPHQEVLLPSPNVVHKVF